MRVTVRDERAHFNGQTHAYAEYKTFSALVPHAEAVECVTVSLRRPSRQDAAPDGGAVCTIRIELSGGEVVEVGATGRHVCAAIDRTVSLLRGAPEMAPRAAVRAV